MYVHSIQLQDKAKLTLCRPLHNRGYLSKTTIFLSGRRKPKEEGKGIGMKDEMGNCA